MPARDEAGIRHDLATAISVLEHLGIIDFNGHFSVRLEDGRVLINTGASVRSAIQPEDLVIVGPNGEIDDALPRPPAELPLHIAVYRSRPDVHAVVHGHPKWSTLLSTAGLDYRVVMAQGALLGDVPQYPSPRSVRDAATAAEVAETLGEGHAVLLQAHGSVVVAASILQATVLAIYLELNVERQVTASLLGTPRYFTDEQNEAARKGLAKPELLEKCWHYYVARLNRSGRPHSRA